MAETRTIIGREELVAPIDNPAYSGQVCKVMGINNKIYIIINGDQDSGQNKDQAENVLGRSVRLHHGQSIPVLQTEGFFDSPGLARAARLLDQE